MVNSHVGQSCATKLAVLSAWIAVFVPGHLYGWLVERSYSVLLLFIAIVSFTSVAGRSPLNYIGRRNNIILLGLLIITVLYFFSAALTTVSTAYGMTMRDTLDLQRYIISGAVLVIMGNAEPSLLRVAAEKLMLVSLCFSLVVLFMYLVDVPLITGMVQWLYEDTKTAISFPNWVRLAAPFENPNFLAFYTLLCLSYGVFFASGRYQIILIALGLVVLAATGSRSGFVATALLFAGLFARILLSVFHTSRMILWQDIRIFLFLVFVVGCILWFFLPYLLESSRVQMVLAALEEGGITHEHNLAVRLEMIAEAFRLFSEKPLLGWGPLKSGSLDVIDNQFFQLLARQGFVGFVLVISIMLYIFSGAIKFAQTRAERFGVIFMWLAVVLMLMTGAFLNNFRLFSLFVFFIVAFTGKRTVNRPMLFINRISPQSWTSLK